MDFETFYAKLSDYITRYEEYSKEATKIAEQKRMSQKSKGNNQRVFLKNGKMVVEDIPEKTLSNELPEEIYSFLDQNIDEYLNASLEDRNKIRKACEDYAFTEFLCKYAFRANEQFQTTKDIIWLVRGVAAISIENFWIDFRDVIRYLQELHNTAIKIGIDPRPIFERISSVSSSEIPQGGPIPLSETLKNLVK